MIGHEKLLKLQRSTVLVVGLGGVGSYALEALVRSGIGSVVIIDKDTVDITNINRQIIALHSTIGQDKCEVARRRIYEINPNCQVEAYKIHYDKKQNNILDKYKFSYIIDCCDTVSAKLDLIEYATKKNIPIISSMGTANKTDPTKFAVMNLLQTSYDPLARVLRREIRKRKIETSTLKVVCSLEKPKKPLNVGNLSSNIRKEQFPPASNAFVPATSGLICASYVINQLIE